MSANTVAHLTTQGKTLKQETSQHSEQGLQLKEQIAAQKKATEFDMTEHLAKSKMGLQRTADKVGLQKKANGLTLDLESQSIEESAKL